MTAPDTYTEYETDWREPHHTAEMAKVRLMEQMVAAMNDQNACLEAIAENTAVLAYHASDGEECYYP